MGVQKGMKAQPDSNFITYIIIYRIIISPNEVFSDIMVLASPRPPVDPDDVNTLSSKYFGIFDTFRALERLRSQPNDVFCFPQIFKMQYLHAFKPLYHVRELSTGIIHPCSQIMLHLYSVKVIVAIVNIGSLRFLIWFNDLYRLWYDYSITRNAFKKRQG